MNTRLSQVKAKWETVHGKRGVGQQRGDQHHSAGWSSSRTSRSTAIANARQNPAHAGPAPRDRHDADDDRGSQPSAHSTHGTITRR